MTSMRTDDYNAMSVVEIKFTFYFLLNLHFLHRANWGRGHEADINFSSTEVGQCSQPSCYKALLQTQTRAFQNVADISF